ncbi:MAG TPA: non-heme iron oxygenase ferredoxin subunit [Candidatus Binatia bacterium]|nr:non-heme iron oxygenase ferredoxin subunit [Candidatus Binatia bacterium]
MTGEAETSGDDGFRDVAALADLVPGAKLACDVDGRSVLVCNAGGEVHAVENACTHAGIPLASGRLRGCILECPMHGGRFDVRDGRPVAGPPRRALARFEVRIRDGRVAVRVAPES